MTQSLQRLEDRFSLIAEHAVEIERYTEKSHNLLLVHVLAVVEKGLHITDAHRPDDDADN